MSFTGYDNWNDYLLDHPKVESRYKEHLNSVSAKYTINKRKQYRKDKQMEKTPTFTIKKRDNAPDYVLGNFGCKYEDLKEFVNDRGYINFDILKSKESVYYAKVNDYGVKKGSATKTDTQENVLEFDDEEIRF